ncbi:MAG: sugar phosphate isomerase/epimerase family protein [Myxococcota bacterium]
MPRFALATLNHSPLHGIPSQWSAHLDAAVEAGFDALAPDVFWLRALVEEGFALSTLSEEMKARDLSCMEIAGIAIGAPEATRAELEENLRYAEALEAEFVNARIVAPMDAAVVESFGQCVEAFAKVGTEVALEFSRGTTLQGIADARALIESASKGGGVTLDTWHFFLAPSGPDWEALADLPLSQFANVQLSDGVPYPEGAFPKATMNERRMPGEGEFDFSRLAEVLREKEFDAEGRGAIVVEVLNADWRARPLEGFATTLIEASRKALARSGG